MKLSNKYKTSEYLFLFSILVLALLLGTYFSFYAFLWRDIKSEVKGFNKYHLEGMKLNTNTNTNICCEAEDGKCVCGNQDCNMSMNCSP